MSEEQRSVLVCITGRVQGVWFRGWIKKAADALGLCGWVRNLPDGSVEALFTGRLDLVEEMIEKCRRGSPVSRVDELTINEQTPIETGTLPAFEIRS